MTTFNATVGGTTRLQNTNQNLQLISKVIDLQAEADDLNSGTAFAATDILQVLNIPAKTYVIAAGILPITEEGATLTGDLGDGDTADGWVDGLNLNATTAAQAQIAEAYGAGTALGKLYASADTIDLKIATIGSQTSHAFVGTVWALCVQIPVD